MSVDGPQWRLYGVFAVLCAFAIGQAALGATPRIEETTVTASRLGVTDQQVVVLDEEELSRVGMHIADLIATLPGLAMSTAGPHGALSQARVRGAEANHLLVLIDGVPANDPAGGGEFDFGGLDPTGIQRIEYLPGAQSAVWGSDALAGVLHILTTPAASGRRLSIAGGSDATLAANATWTRFGEDSHATASIGRHRTDGSNAAREGTENDSFDRTAAQIAGARGVGVWRISASGRARSGHAEYDPAPAPRFVPADGDRRTDADFRLLQATATRAYGGQDAAHTLTYRLATARTARANFADGAFASSSVGRRDSASAAGNFGIGRYRANLTAQFAAETFAQSAPATAFGDPNQRQRMATASLAGEFQGSFGPVAVAASARRDANDAFGNSIAYRFGATVGQTPAWFASIGSGVKNPTFTERFGYTPDTFAGNPQLRPETATSVEAGARWDSERAQLVVAVFRSVLEDEIDGFHFDAARGAFTARNLESTSTRRGIEVRGHARFGRVSLDGSYSYIDSTVAGERELRRPRHLANARLTAHLSPRLNIRAALSHTGSSSDQDFSTWPATRIRLDAFRLLRLDAEYAATPRWRWQLAVENALDRDYATVYGYRSPGRTALLRAVVDF